MLFLCCYLGIGQSDLQFQWAIQLLLLCSIYCQYVTKQADCKWAHNSIVIRTCDRSSSFKNNLDRKKNAILVESHFERATHPCHWLHVHCKAGRPVAVLTTPNDWCLQSVQTRTKGWEWKKSLLVLLREPLSNVKFCSAAEGGRSSVEGGPSCARSSTSCHVTNFKPLPNSLQTHAGVLLLWEIQWTTACSVRISIVVLMPRYTCHCNCMNSFMLNKQQSLFRLQIRTTL